MLFLITFPLALVLSLCWYRPCYKAQGDARTMQKSDYRKAALKYGLLIACVPIIVSEITWDAIADRTSLSGLPKDLISDFFRAALLEEAFKLMAFLIAKKELGLRRKSDHILIAGLIGLVYGVVEKAVGANIVGVFVGLAIPMHIVWQLNQGGHYYEYEKAKAEGDKPRARKEFFMAVFLPFILHGCWDSGLDIMVFCIGREAVLPQVFGGILCLAMLVGGIVYSVKSIKKCSAMIREEAAAEKLPELGEDASEDDKAEKENAV